MFDLASPRKSFSSAGLGADITIADLDESTGRVNIVADLGGGIQVAWVIEEQPPENGQPCLLVTDNINRQHLWRYIGPLPAHPQARQSAPAVTPGQNDWLRFANGWVMDLLRSPGMRAIMDATISAEDQRTFLDGLNQSQTELVENRYHVGSGCAPGVCGFYESFFVFDSVNEELFAVVYFDEKFKIPSDFRKQPPSEAVTARFREWREVLE